MSTAGEGIATLRTWSTVARGAIGLFLFVLALLIIANGLLLYLELSRDLGMGIGAYSPVLALTLGATNVLVGLFLLVATVPVIGWIYRAHANLHEAGLDELRYSPRWSVGSFFVPLVNLVVPFRAMRELHNRSHGEGPWQAATPVGDVTSWWACLLAATAVSTVAAMVAFLATI